MRMITSPGKTEGGSIIIMGRDRIDETPDLFSTGGASPLANQASHFTAMRRLRRPVLPKDLPTAIKYLDDRELDRLIAAAVDEARRRRRLPPSLEASLTNSNPEPPRQRQVAAARLTSGQVNAVRAAFKAGVTPARIARQFALSQSDVRKALASDQTKR